MRNLKQLYFPSISAVSTEECNHQTLLAAKPHVKQPATLEVPPELVSRDTVRITVFCSAIVIDVIVHSHTAGAL